MAPEQKGNAPKTKITTSTAGEDLTLPVESRTLITQGDFAVGSQYYYTAQKNGNSTRDWTIRKIKLMNAYILESSGRTLLACIHVAENEVRNSTCLDKIAISSHVLISRRLHTDFFLLRPYYGCQTNKNYSFNHRH